MYLGIYWRWTNQLKLTRQNGIRLILFSGDRIRGHKIHRSDMSTMYFIWSLSILHVRNFLLSVVWKATWFLTVWRIEALVPPYISLGIGIPERFNFPAKLSEHNRPTAENAFLSEECHCLPCYYTIFTVAKKHGSIHLSTTPWHGSLHTCLGIQSRVLSVI